MKLTQRARRRLSRLLLVAAHILHREEVLAWQWFVTARPTRWKWSIDPCANAAMILEDGARYCPQCHRPAERYNPLTDQNELPSPERCLECGWTPKSLLEILAENS